MTDQISNKFLFIINDAPYGNERPYNALRLAHEPRQTRWGRSARLSYRGWCACALKGQKTPAGYYNIERMVKALASRGKVAT